MSNINPVVLKNQYLGWKLQEWYNYLKHENIGQDDIETMLIEIIHDTIKIDLSR